MKKNSRIYNKIHSRSFYNCIVKMNAYEEKLYYLYIENNRKRTY